MTTAIGNFHYSRYTPQGLIKAFSMGTSAELTLLAAQKYGITYHEIPGTRIIELEYQGQKSYFQGQNPFAQSGIALFATSDKTVGKNLLIAAGLSVAKGFSIYKKDPEAYWEEVYNALQKPIVVKPTHGTQGRQVYTSINNLNTYKAAIKDILPSHPSTMAGVIAEEMFQGEEYRILVNREAVLGIINRRPANVVGDGVTSIQELINRKNKDPRRKNDPNNFLVTINVDQHVQAELASQKLTLNSIPAKNQLVLLRKNSNISTGGDSLDVTDQAHQTVKEIALKAINAIPGLLFAGIDFMTKDITQSQTAGSYIVVETNESPGYSIHDLPYEGKNRHAAEFFLKILFPTLELKLDE